MRVFNKISLIILGLIVVSTPILSQTAEITNACAQGEIDAERDVNEGLWFLGGCLFGIIGVGAAYLIEPNPPAMRLLGKSPEYVAAYTDCYKQKARNLQTKNAWIGCIVGNVASAILYMGYVLLLATAMSTSY